MSTKTGLKTGFPAAGIGERYFSRPGVPLAALAAVVAAAGATGYGFQLAGCLGLLSRRPRAGAGWWAEQARVIAAGGRSDR